MISWSGKYDLTQGTPGFNDQLTLSDILFSAWSADAEPADPPLAESADGELDEQLQPRQWPGEHGSLPPQRAPQHDGARP